MDYLDKTSIGATLGSYVRRSHSSDRKKIGKIEFQEN